MLLVIRFPMYDNVIHRPRSQLKLTGGTPLHIGSLSLFDLRFSYLFPHGSEGKNFQKHVMLELVSIFDFSTAENLTLNA